MWIYYTIFFLIAFVYYRMQPKAPDKETLWYTMLALGVFVGLGDMLGGYDRYIYGEVFDDSVDIRLEGGNLIDVLYQPGAFNEKGYMLYNYLLSFVTANRYIFIFVSSVIIFLSFAYAFHRFLKENWLFALIVFLGMFFFITFTYLREVMAICMSFWALKAVVDRKLLRFLLFVALAYSFHHSAIILLPIYFFPLKKWAPNTIVAIAVICFALGVFGVSRLGFTAFSAFSGGDFRSEMYAREFDIEGYFRIDYAVEAIFFLSCILSLYRRIGKDKRSLVLLNYSLAFCFILLLFIRSPQGGRLGWYFLIGIIVLVTEIVHKQSTQWRLILFVVSFFLFNRIVVDWDYMLSPYKTFLTNGHRDKDFAFQRFEYDEKYDKDKFYRPAFILFGSDDDSRNANLQ